MIAQRNISTDKYSTDILYAAILPYPYLYPYTYPYRPTPYTMFITYPVLGGDITPSLDQHLCALCMPPLSSNHERCALTL